MSTSYTIVNNTGDINLIADAAAGDKMLKYTMPQAEYMYGCSATAIGMLLGYYDLYGYTFGSKTYDYSKLIPGTITVNSRGSDGGSIYDMKDPSVLAKFIASTEYVDRFYETSSATEKQYSFVNGDPEQGLNVSVWNCLADYLGTGQYWRGNVDLSTCNYFGSLEWVQNTKQTEWINGENIPAKYVDFKYGLSLYVESVGYKLDAEKTESYEIEDFTFSMFKNEIDAGRPVLISLENYYGNYGHMVVAYGYNDYNQTIIFDDTYRSDCRMKWYGTYEYSDEFYSIRGVTTVVFEVEDPEPPTKSDITIVRTSVVDFSVGSDDINTIHSITLETLIRNTGTTSTGDSFKIKVFVDGKLFQTVTTKALAAGESRQLSLNLGTYDNTPGTHTWELQLDADNNIAETDETNNIESGTFRINTPDTPEPVDSNTISKTLYIGPDETRSSLKVISGGSVYNNGTISGMTLSSAGVAFISSGATTENVNVSSGGKLYIRSGGDVSGARIHSGGLTQINGKLCDLTINRGGFAHISSGGMADDLTVSSGANLYISSGGTLTGTAIFSSGANVSASNGAKIIFDLTERQPGTTPLIENLSVVSGNPDYSVTVTASLSTGNYVLASGAATFNSTISVCNSNTCFGSISLNGNTVTYSGKTYSLNNSNGNLTLQVVQSAAPEPPPQSGNVFVYSSGSVVSRADEVSGIVLNNGEYTSMKVSSGGTARDTTILSGGHAYVYKGGEVHNTKISSWGNFYVNGGCAYNTEISSASVYASAGGVLSNTTAYYQGGLRLSNGSAINNTLSRGYIYAYNGALADSTVVHSGGNIYLYNKGIVQNTQINSGGKLYISSGGTHKGSLQIENGATVSAYKGAKIDFTLSGRTEADDYLLNNLLLIKGAPSYTISVDSDQTDGTYKLAQGASALTGTFPISSGATVLGNISINGTILEADGKTYDLNNVNGDLTLTISTPIQSIFTAGNFNGSGGIFEWKSDNTAYIRNQTEKTQISGTLNVSDWTLLGAGDFNRSGSDGLLWMEKASGNVYIQNDLDSFDEITNKTNCLGCAGEGYTILSTGDFTGTGIAGVVMQGPAFGDESISLNYGLPIWGRETDGSTFPGWLGALVNTWQPGQTLKGNPADAADINANNYMYEVVAVGDYNGDGTDDVMLQNIMPTSVNGITITGSGDVFTFLTGNIDAVKNGVSPIVAYAGCASGGWKIAGSGDFDGDGTTDTLLSDGTGVAGWKMIAGQRAGDQWFGTLAAGQEIAGIADLNNDGTDDILLCDRTTGIYSGWLVQNGAVTGTLAIA